MAAGQVPPPTSLEDVTSQFVTFYYKLRIQKPSDLIQAYTDDSKVGRVAADGFLYSATKQEAFEQNTLLVGGTMSVDLKKIDAQFSANNCVLIAVKGDMVGDEVIRHFTQTFLLAPLPPPTPGYYIYNDMFRYEDEVELDLKEEKNIKKQHTEEEQVLPEAVHASGAEQDNSVRPTPMTQPSVSSKAVAKTPAAVTPAANLVVVTPVAKLTAATTQVARATVSPPGPSTTAEAPPVTKVAKVPEVEPGLSTTDEAVASRPQTYASVLTEKKAPPAVPPSAPVIRQPTPSATSKSVPSSSAPARPLPTASLTRPPPAVPASTAHSKVASGVTSNAAKNSSNPEVDPYGIYISNLNPCITHEQLKTEFSQFGPVKPSLVRIYHNPRICANYAFLEFELKSSATKAIEMGEIWLRGPAKIEAKRKFPSKRRNDDTNRGSTSRGGSQGAYVQVANSNSRPGNTRSIGNPRNTGTNSRNSKGAAPPKRHS